MAITRGSFGSKERQTEALLTTLLAEMAAAQLLRVQQADELRRIREIGEEQRDLLEAQQQIEAQKLDLLFQILRAVERRSRPRDADDERVMMALTASIGTTKFTTAEVVQHAKTVAPELREALAAADCETPRALGRLFRRIEGRDIKGVMLMCLGEDRSGLVWCVRVCATSPESGR
jgi:predicted transcriptional regulator